MSGLKEYLEESLPFGRGQIAAVLSLFDNDATIPFIARYRKDQTGGLTETELREIQKAADYFGGLEKRKSYIFKVLQEKKITDPRLLMAIGECRDKDDLEDLYKPYKSAKKSRALLALEKGMGRFAASFKKMSEAEARKKTDEIVLNSSTPWESAQEFTDDLLALWIHEITSDPATRNHLKSSYSRAAEINCRRNTKTEDPQERFRDYYEYQERAERMQPHRISAVLRGVDKKILSLSVKGDWATCTGKLERRFMNPRIQNPLYNTALNEAWKKGLQPSLKNDLLKGLRARAEEKAIAIFAENLASILMEAPFGPHSILAVDPGFRTGCKWVILDDSGSLKEKGVIYPVEPFAKLNAAVSTIGRLEKRYRFSAAAIGNGTAGRETLAFFKEHFPGVRALPVNESGASVYSASETAIEEFPDLDITFRGAVSIGRRLMDPLAELIKIDPGSIGVGQYQHDVDQKNLADRLDEVCESCVNNVGVNINTASRPLLNHVSGLNKTLAARVVEYRAEKGLFRSRKEIMKVKGLGEKAFLLCAGFLKIPESGNPLDNTFIHPEQYPVVEKLAGLMGCSLGDLINMNRRVLAEESRKLPKDLLGRRTLDDIIDNLSRPDRDPRQTFEVWDFADKHDISELEKGEVLPGIVTNLTGFGAFVDLGVHQDGLVHVSEMADRFVSDPAEILSTGDKIHVKVIDVDVSRKRISLSLKQAGEQ